MVTIWIYNREEDKAVECGFGTDATMAVIMVLPGINKQVFEEPLIKEELTYIDEVTNQVFINEPVEGKPVIFNGTLQGLKSEMKALGL
jgi:hypothetical protein